MNKKLLVILASLALVLAVNFGLASAHPSADPTPPPADVEQEGENQDGQTDQPEAGDAAQTDTEMNAVEDQQGDQGEQDRNTEQDGEFEGDN